jgi:cell division protein FtsB
MCLTNTVNLIDFDNLGPDDKKKEQLEAIKKKLEARREFLRNVVKDLDDGLRKLDEKLKRY